MLILKDYFLLSGLSYSKSFTVVKVLQPYNFKKIRELLFIFDKNNYLTEFNAIKFFNLFYWQYYNLNVAFEEGNMKICMMLTDIH